MEYLIMVAIAIAAFVLGAYAFNSIVISSFYTLPRFKQEMANENLVKPLPWAKLILKILLSLTLFVAIMYYTYPYYMSYPWAVFAGLGIAMVGVYTKLMSKKGEKEVEFIEEYGEFLKNK